MVKPMVMVFLLFILTTGTRGQTANDVNWAKRVDTGSQVVTTMQFYFHDTLSGSNPSAIQVAQPQSSSRSLGGFGSLMMVDDPLTEGPDKNSKLIGHARGMYGQAAQNELGLIMVLSYCFTDGIYKDSTFSLLSLNLAMQTVREMTIVGGTGLFRLARGYALAQTYSINSSGDAVVGNQELSPFLNPYCLGFLFLIKKMKKEHVMLILCTIVIAIPLVQSISEGRKGVEKWFKQLPLKKQKVTKLHFYFHDTTTGPSQTAYQIFESNISSTTITQFGRAFMFDNPLTVEPDVRSMTIGKGQGFFGAASFERPRFLMNLNFVFTQGKFNGSTLQFLGTNPILNPVREMSIVGGTGVFRLARGIATAETYFLNDTSSIVEYNLVVLHY
ncbi:hypothetical protein LXL04_019677 [Taraxacum kok-saghyz]